MHSRSELLAQAVGAYPRYLRALVAGEPFFPLPLRTGKTRRAADYEGLRRELEEFRAAAASLGIVVNWRDVNSPRFAQERPESAVFADEESFLRALGKVEEARAFRADLALIREALPGADEWIAANAPRIVRHHGEWPQLLRVACWFREHPRCGLYLRQLPIEDVDTKFFETRTGILDALLLLANPAAVTHDSRRFEERHGLRWEQPLIRLRFLDPQFQAAHGFPVSDLAVPAPAFRQLTLRDATVVITENLRNFLALPALTNGVAVFGGGNAVPLLAGAPWLAASRLLYWGDIDAHGFLMLSRLRAAFPQTASFLMDAATVEAGSNLTGLRAPAGFDLPARLTAEEAALFERVRDGSVCLEQERIPFPYVLERLSAVLGGSPPTPSVRVGLFKHAAQQ